jgi:nicotinamidase-related amidase
MDVATMPTKPEDAARIVAASAELLHFARARGVPVIHAVLVHRKLPNFGSESMAQPFWRAVATVREAENRLTPGRASTVTAHNSEGSPGTQIIPALYAPGDYVIDNNKRLDCFYGTDLRALLDTLGVANVCLMGINTNTCVLNTAFTAFNFDYRVVVLSPGASAGWSATMNSGAGSKPIPRVTNSAVTNLERWEFPLRIDA